MTLCPICQTKTTWKENPHRPFCSERCKLLDLGNWADGSYRFSEDTPQEGQEALEEE